MTSKHRSNILPSGQKSSLLLTIWHCILSAELTKMLNTKYKELCTAQCLINFVTLEKLGYRFIDNIARQ